MTRERVLEIWRYALASGKLTPNMKEIVQAVLNALVPGPTPNRQKVLNTLKDMVAQSSDSTSERLFLETITLLETEQGK